MISAKNLAVYDDTPLMYEELTEMYFLDKETMQGVFIPDDLDFLRHETGLEEVMPDDFTYSAPEHGKGKLTNTRSYDWSLTYQFSSDFRNPYVSLGRYGNPDMTFRRLYIILCERFNCGVYFIDEYFRLVYPFNGMKDIVEEELKEAKETYLYLMESTAKRFGKVTKKGKLDMRYGINKIAMQSGLEGISYEADIVAQMVKDDIHRSLETGEIPILMSPSDTTLLIREYLGINSAEPFFATGQLIDDLRIFFRLEKKEWKTKSNIMV